GACDRRDGYATARKGPIWLMIYPKRRGQSFGRDYSLIEGRNKEGGLLADRFRSHRLSTWLRCEVLLDDIAASQGQYSNQSVSQISSSAPILGSAVNRRTPAVVSRTE